MRIRYRTPRQREKAKTGKSAVARHSSCYTKKGPGRRHVSGSVRPSIAKLPEFGVDKKGNPIVALPSRYMHSHRRRAGDTIEVRQ